MTTRRTVEEETLLRELVEANEQLVLAGLRERDLAERAERLADEARTATKMRDELLAAVSHDVASPLVGIRLAAEALLIKIDGGQIAEVARKPVEMIRATAAHTVGVMDGLADVAAVHAGQLELVQNTQDLAGLVEQAFTIVAPFASPKEVTLALDVEGVCRAHVDPVRMTRALHNLVSNAVKFTHHGGHVSVRVARSGGAIDVAVVDDGPGIKEADLPLLFEPYRSDRSGPGAGRGIGLYIAQGIVRAHGGEIRVACPPEGGSRFTFTVPAVD